MLNRKTCHSPIQYSTICRVRCICQEVGAEMEMLPVEVIGIILSHISAAHDVVMASVTSKKWREAARHHLHNLSFDCQDWPAYRDLSVSQCEVLITQTILQTKQLRNLSICLKYTEKFSAAPVIAWLMYTRETLRSLTYMIKTKPDVNILEKCGRQKLEKLVLGFASISTVDPSIQKFPCLRSLSLQEATVSALDLNSLLSACPTLEMLSLVKTEITPGSGQFTMELNSPSLKSLYIEAMNVDYVILEADTIESLHLQSSNFDHFEVISKGSLRSLRMRDASIMQLDISEGTELLEIIDVTECDISIMWTSFLQMILKASKLKQLRLWDLPFDADEIVMDIEAIALSFPCLQRLALKFELPEDLYRHALHGSACLEKVAVLELGSSMINDLFGWWIAGLLERCPNLKQLIVRGEVSEAKCLEDYQAIGRFTTFMVDVLRRYPRVDAKFEFS